MPCLTSLFSLLFIFLHRGQRTARARARRQQWKLVSVSMAVHFVLQVLELALILHVYRTDGRFDSPEANLRESFASIPYAHGANVCYRDNLTDARRPVLPIRRPICRSLTHHHRPPHLYRYRGPSGQALGSWQVCPSCPPTPPHSQWTGHCRAGWDSDPARGGRHGRRAGSGEKCGG